MNITYRQLGLGFLISMMLGFAPFSANAQKKLEDRVTRLERLLESSALIDMHNQQEQLRRALEEAQAEVDQMRRELDEIKQRQHDLYLDNDRRLQQLEKTALPSTPTKEDKEADEDEGGDGSEDKAADPQDKTADDETAADPADERDAYQAALDALRAGRYEEATTAFQEFLKRYPKSHYTANALYWLGESYYVVRDFANALPAFQRVLEEHPNSSKEPDALLKIGFIHHENGDTDQARSTLEKIRDDYAGTSAAALAEQRLKRL